MKRTLTFVVAALVTFPSMPSTALAQMPAKEAKCVSILHKDIAKVASGRGAQIAACVAGVQGGSVPDFGACLVAEDPKQVASLAKLDADVVKACGFTPPFFGIPAALDTTMRESASFHTDGLLTDILGSSPVIATGDAGACQAAVLKNTQKFVAGWRKAFGKCVKLALKGGAADSSDLDACVAPDMTTAGDKLVAAITKACAGVLPASSLPGVCSAATDATVGDCVETRARCRACREMATSGGLDADCDMVDDSTDNDSCSFPVSISGNAFDFYHGNRVDGAVISILEHPEIPTTATNSDGYFEFNDLQEGEEVTLVLEHPDYHPFQTGTNRLGPYGAELVSFQAVLWEVYDGLAFVLGLTPDEVNKCQMVTTVTRVGKSLYDPGAHGEANAVVSTLPALPAENGPIYFNSDVLPQPNLVRTSDDGGALYVQVPPGTYTWKATKGDFIFSRIKSKCRVGMLVDASPPWGLQKH